jgi:hypothetical protein
VFAQEEERRSGSKRDEGRGDVVRRCGLVTRVCLSEGLGTPTRGIAALEGPAGCAQASCGRSIVERGERCEGFVPRAWVKY